MTSIYGCTDNKGLLVTFLGLVSRSYDDDMTQTKIYYFNLSNTFGYLVTPETDQLHNDMFEELVIQNVLGGHI